MTPHRFFSVVGLEQFEHYHDRKNPPWIKLHYSILRDDPDFMVLPTVQKFQVLAIRLLATRYQNRLKYDPVFIQKSIGIDEEVDIDSLVTAGFLRICEDASGALAKTIDSASSTLAESGFEKKISPHTPLKENIQENPPYIPPGGKKRRKQASSQTTAPAEFVLTPEQRAWAGGILPRGLSLDAQTEKFLDHHRAKGSRFSSWSAAWRNWIRNARDFAARDAGANGHNPHSQVGAAEDWQPAPEPPWLPFIVPTSLTAEAFYESLKMRMSPQGYETWIRPSEVRGGEEITAAGLQIYVPNDYFRTWFLQNIHGILDKKPIESPTENAPA